MRSLVIAITLSTLAAPPASAQSVRDFAGTFDLVRAESLQDDGTWAPNTQVFGRSPTGVIMYDGVGTMGVHIIRSGDAASSTRYFAYYGRYTVDAVRGTVTHHLENHVDARQIGNDNVRGFDFDEDLLILTVEPQRRLRIVWRRRR